MTKSVYLAGPIIGKTYEECMAWREFAERELRKYDIQGFSPMRFKGSLAKEGMMRDGFDGILTCAKAIVTRDRYDCMNCDALLVNLLNAPRISQGTMVEYGWADAFRKPIITVMEKTGNVNEHAFIRELSGFRVETLEEGILVARAILTPTL